METFAVPSGNASSWHEVAHWKLFDLQRDPRCKGPRILFLVMETFTSLRGIRQNRHEVAHWELFGIMETFAIPGKSFQCAREVGVSMTRGEGG